MAGRADAAATGGGVLKDRRQRLLARLLEARRTRARVAVAMAQAQAAGALREVDRLEAALDDQEFGPDDDSILLEGMAETRIELSERTDVAGAQACAAQADVAGHVQILARIDHAREVVETRRQVQARLDASRAMWVQGA